MGRHCSLGLARPLTGYVKRRKNVRCEKCGCKRVCGRMMVCVGVSGGVKVHACT